MQSCAVSMNSLQIFFFFFFLRKFYKKDRRSHKSRQIGRHLSTERDTSCTGKRIECKNRDYKGDIIEIMKSLLLIYIYIYYMLHVFYKQKNWMHYKICRLIYILCYITCYLELNIRNKHLEFVKNKIEQRQHIKFLAL